LPLIVYAAQLPPIDNLWRFTEAGADAVCFSGGKGLRGPQGSGLVLGKKWIIDGVAMIGPPTHGIARSQKVGREEIVGLFTALEEYLKPGMVANKIAVIESADNKPISLDAPEWCLRTRVSRSVGLSSIPYQRENHRFLFR
jgi:seryl-tRNA(Sec) selenium transferase